MVSITSGSPESGGNPVWGFNLNAGSFVPQIVSMTGRCFPICTAERGVVYLAVILDACSRKVIGYALGRQIDTQLTLAALKAAGIQRRPVPGTCIHHSDRGCQWASAEYRRALHEYGLMGSMRSVANPYDNAQAESLMKTLKVEEVYLAGYESFSDVAARRPIFIEEVYNTQRLHSALGYLSPHPFEVKRARQGGQFS